MASSSEAKAAEYKRAVEQAEIAFIGAMESSFKVDEDYDDFYKKADKYIDQALVREGGYDPDNKLLEGFVRFRVWMMKEGAPKAKSPDEGFKNALFACEVVYRVVFKVSGEYEAEDPTLSVFFERTAPFATWAYFRAHLAHAAAEACIDVPILPVKKQFYPLERTGEYRAVPPPKAKAAAGGK